MASRKPLAKRVAFITGGATGIGFGIASQLAAHGAKVVLASRNKDHLDQAARKLAKSHAKPLTLELDVRDAEAVAQAINRTRETCGGLDVLINNAAGNFVCPTAELSPNAWKAVIDIDLNGTFHCCRAAYPALCESSHGGRIINITMTRTLSGWPGCAHAAAAKAGILSLTRTLAVEWGPQGIRTNAIAPGLIQGTEGARRLIEERGLLEQARGQIPLGRLGRIQDVANLALFLISPAADQVNGAEFTVDGGQCWHPGPAWADPEPAD
ncbi:MAG: SDR family oxidoreductase [Candidatus Competibacterales bacterium]|nr:SDR family oxidoreductase [Candidatus Competibacterales bacterium]